MKLRPIAFVLPQFHPIPENDKWWGKGFTEWTNVKKALPQYKGHYQPHVPTDLGYYDLREPNARQAQADIAQEHGIYGFCYYHYWFNGKRLLNYPIDEMLRLKSPNIPFMLCWANENWTRRWDGLDNDILIKQEYSYKDDKEHMRWLCEKVFSDPRYIRVNDCPVFIVYRQDLFHDINKTIKIWRKIATEEYGLKGLYLCSTESFHRIIDPQKQGFDASVEFSPHQIMSHIIPKTISSKFLEFLRIKKQVTVSLRDIPKGINDSMNRKMPKFKLYRSVTPNWDNTARKKGAAFVGIGGNPKLFGKWFGHLVNSFKPYSNEENFIFINAMNEWAEGNHLEPCEQFGRGYLEAIRKVMTSNKE